MTATVPVMAQPKPKGRPDHMYAGCLHGSAWKAADSCNRSKNGVQHRTVGHSRNKLHGNSNCYQKQMLFLNCLLATAGVQAAEGNRQEGGCGAHNVRLRSVWHC